MSIGSSGNLSGEEGEIRTFDKDMRTDPVSTAGKKFKEEVDDRTGVDLLEEQLAEQKKQTQVLENEAEQAKKEIQEEEQKLRDEANRKQQELSDQQRASTEAANRKRRRRFAAKNSLLTNQGGSQGLLGTGGSLYG